jgi:hypothetical protein
LDFGALLHHAGTVLARLVSCTAASLWKNLLQMSGQPLTGQQQYPHTTQLELLVVKCPELASTVGYCGGAGGMLPAVV